MDTESDAALWQRVLDGDGRSFGTLFDRHRDRVFRHCGWLGAEGVDAEDLTATVFLELWRLRSRVSIVDDSLLPWLLATATNVGRNASRSRRRYGRLLAALPRPVDVADPVVVAEGRLAFGVRATHVAEMMRGLSLIDQQLIALTTLEGVSVEHASRAVGISYGAAKTRLSRARQRLRELPGIEGATP